MVDYNPPFDTFMSRNDYVWHYEINRSKKGIQSVEGPGCGSFPYDSTTTNASPSTTKPHLSHTEDAEDPLNITDKHANPFLDFSLGDL